MIKKSILILSSILILLICYVSYSYYQQIFNEILDDEHVLFIRSDATLSDVEKELIDVIGERNIFIWLAHKKKYSIPKSGKYTLSKGMSLNDIINLLRNGNQTPVRVSFNNQDNLEKFSKRVSEQIEADSIDIFNSFTDPVFLEEHNLTKTSVLGILIPNTYEIYWNTSPEKFRDRMLKEYVKFWNKERLSKAKELTLTPSQVMTLASIVQKETAKVIERPIVAGLYINRLKKGIPLQADPTIIYILKHQLKKKFDVKRVLYKDLKIKSPFNTYINKGLPPHVIAMPDISSIEAVLNYTQHRYLYMCADSENLGFHLFSNSLKQHNRNARKYQRWLSNLGVNR